MDIVKHVKQVVAEAAAFRPKINSKASYEAAGKSLKTVSTAMKMVEEHYAQQKAEAYAEYQKVMSTIKEVQEPLGVAKVNLKEAMQGYLEKEQQKAIAKAAKVAEKSPGKVALPPEQYSKVPVVEGVQQVKRWVWELVDIDKVGREWLVLDEKAVNAEVRASKGKAQGALGEGIRVYQETTVRG